MITTPKEAADYLQRALRWANVDMHKIDAHSVPNYLEAYEAIEPITQEEADVVIQLVIRWYEKTLKKLEQAGR